MTKRQHWDIDSSYGKPMTIACINQRAKAMGLDPTKDAEKIILEVRIFGNQQFMSGKKKKPVRLYTSKVESYIRLQRSKE